jgi:hypothetical protein
MPGKIEPPLLVILLDSWSMLFIIQNMDVKYLMNLERIVDNFLHLYFRLDILVTDFLASYFIENNFKKNGDKRKEFIECFLENERFVKNTEILTRIISKKYPQYTDTIKKEYFDRIRILRNNIAHSLVDFEINSSDYSQSIVKIHKFKKGEIESEELSFKNICDTNEICFDVLLILDLEVKKLQGKNHPLEALSKAFSKKKK